MHVYNVLMSDNTVKEIYADSPEIAEKEAEIRYGNDSVFAVIAESV